MGAPLWSAPGCPPPARPRRAARSPGRPVSRPCSPGALSGQEISGSCRVVGGGRDERLRSGEIRRIAVVGPSGDERCRMRFRRRARLSSPACGWIRTSWFGLRPTGSRRRTVPGTHSPAGAPLLSSLRLDSDFLARPAADGVTPTDGAGYAFAGGRASPLQPAAGFGLLGSACGRRGHADGRCRVRFRRRARLSSPACGWIRTSWLGLRPTGSRRRTVPGTLSPAGAPLLSSLRLDSDFLARPAADGVTPTDGAGYAFAGGRASPLQPAAGFGLLGSACGRGSHAGPSLSLGLGEAHSLETARGQLTDGAACRDP